MKEKFLLIPLLAAGWLSACALMRTPEVITAGTVVEHFSYESDGLKIAAWSVRPAGEGRYPLIALNHGYAVWPLTQIFFDPENSPFLVRAADLARQGYVVFFSHYRGFGDSQGKQTFGPGEVRDILAGLELMKSKPYVDPKRIALVGGSEGAMCSLLAAAGRDDIAAVVEFAGPVDLAQLYHDTPWIMRRAGGLAKKIGGTPQSNPEAYRERSPILAADRIKCPVLIIHGGADSLVSVSHAHSLHEALTQAGVPCQIKIIPGANHGLFAAFSPDGPAAEAWAEAYNFLDQILIKLGS